MRLRGTLPLLLAAVGPLGCGATHRAPSRGVPPDSPTDLPPAHGPWAVPVRDGRAERALALTLRFLEAVDRGDRTALHTLLLGRPWRTSGLLEAPRRHPPRAIEALLAPPSLRGASRSGQPPGRRAGRLPFAPRRLVRQARVRRLDDPTLRWRHARPDGLRASDLLVDLPVPGFVGRMTAGLAAWHGRLRLLVRPEAAQPILGY